MEYIILIGNAYIKKRLKTQEFLRKGFYFLKN